MLEPGDVLLHINASLDSTTPAPFVTHFQALEEACDNAVGASQSVQAAAVAVCARLGAPSAQLRSICRAAAATEWSGDSPAPSWHRVPRWHCEIGIDGEQVEYPSAFVDVSAGTALLGQLQATSATKEDLVAQQDTSLIPATPAVALLTMPNMEALNSLLLDVLAREDGALPAVGALNVGGTLGEAHGPGPAAGAGAPPVEGGVHLVASSSSSR